MAPDQFVVDFCVSDKGADKFKTLLYLLVICFSDRLLILCSKRVELFT
jgi:hypothetical protein